MRTVRIEKETDFATLLSELFGKKATASSSEELRALCESFVPAVLPEYKENIEDFYGYRPCSYAPAVHIAISKKNAHALDALFRSLAVDIDEEIYYLDDEEYEPYPSIEACPTDRVHFTFILGSMAELPAILTATAAKLAELGEDADLIVNLLFPDKDGTIINGKGERWEGVDPALVWELRGGEIKQPNAKMVIFGDDLGLLLFHGCTTLADMPIADWKRLFGVEFEVEFH